MDEHRLNAIAAKQHGLVTRKQIAGLGVSRRTAEWKRHNGEWVRLLPGVFRVAGSPSTWHQRAQAAMEWAAERGVLSHTTAGHLLGFPNLESTSIEVLSSNRLHSPKVAWLRIHFTVDLQECDRTRVGAFAVTSPTRTLIDLASEIHPQRLEPALDFALTNGLTTIDRLDERLQSLSTPGRRGISVIRELVRQRDCNAQLCESPLESRILNVLRKAGLPMPTPQFQVWSNGKFIARVDFAYPDLRLAIEGEGFRFHSAKGQWEHDIARHNALMQLGWKVLRVTWRDLHRKPELLLEALGSMMADLDMLCSPNSTNNRDFGTQKPGPAR